MKKILTARDIKFLMHFTRVSNLASILEHGLLRRTEIDRRSIDYTFNDDERLDGHMDSISCSISFPNYRMFYRLRCENDGEDWVVLALKAQVLNDKSCSYYPGNAATACYRGIPPENLRHEAAFEAMFGDAAGKERSALGLEDRFTTDPQAEVLVFDDIEPQYIVGAITNTKALRDQLREQHKRLQVQWASKLFRPRPDYKNWQG